MLPAVGIILLILLFAYVILMFNSRSAEDRMLTGFWRADAGYCQQAELDLFLIYMGEPGSASVGRPGYILMANQEGLLINNPITFSLSGGLSFKPGLCSSRHYTININWLDDENDEPYDFFPSTQSMYYYPTSGKLVMLAGDSITAILYKDHQMSSLAKEADGESQTPKEAEASEEI